MCLSLFVQFIDFGTGLAVLHPGRSCSLRTHLTRWQDDMFRMFAIDLEKKTHKTTALDCIKHRVIQSNWASRATKPAIKFVTSNICLTNKLSVFVCGENTSCLTFRTEVLAQTLYGIAFFFFFFRWCNYCVHSPSPLSRWRASTLPQPSFTVFPLPLLDALQFRCRFTWLPEH